jgi:sortase A
MRIVSLAQRALLVIAIVLLGIYVGAHVHRRIAARAELLRFEKLRTDSRLENSLPKWLPKSELKVDFSEWSTKRVEAYQNSLAEHFNPPLAVLRIAKVHLEVPVLEGTDDLTLNRGVGHIEGTGRPGEEGNVGIAGHRDGFFRVLKDIGPGDEIEVLTANRKDIYKVNQVVLVRPSDVSVLEPRAGRFLTLVTCYPFYFIGSAPQRYIVQASIINADDPAIGSRTESRLHSPQP